ncbi:MAG: hypothetical protein JXO48_09195 [Deltaproteobacteria bacterium]|nr:hypothetical protein [Deltaproteobacteria bacterium]
MERVTGDTLSPLMEQQVGICLSMYMPTIQKGAETQQNQIRFKNLLREAEEKLSFRELRPSEIREFLQPAQELVSDIPFWQNQYRGFALFISPGQFSYFRLPREFDEIVVVSDRFHLKPIIPMLSDRMTFYILAISQNSVRLFECSRYGVQEIEITGMPQNINDALNLDTFEKRLQLHTGSEDTKGKILQYFKIVDRKLRDFLKDKRHPLLFAGVDYLFPIFREANTYAHLAETAITGNPEGMDGDDLLHLALPVIESFMEQKRVDALAQYRQNVGTGLSSDNISEIVPAACNGRVGILFIDIDVQVWGRYDPQGNRVFLSGEEEQGHEDLFDLAAIRTTLNGGTVYSIDPKEMPGERSIAAIFRY